MIADPLPWIIPIGSALALLILPGWAVLVLARVPMRRLYGMAAPVTLAMLTVIGGATHLLGVPFDHASVLVGSVLLLILAAVLGRTLWRDATVPEVAPAEPHEPSSHDGAMQHSAAVRVLASVAPALLALIAGLSWVVPSASAIGAIDELAQSFDAFFHHSAVQQLRESGDAFPLTALAPLYNAQTVVYPVGWHSVASLLPGDVVAATNSLVLATLMLLPLTMLPMMDQVLPPGRARRLSLTALLLLPAFLTFPSITLRAGLWPYALAVALLPALIAAILHIRHGRRADPHLSRSVIVLLAAIGGTAATHPALAFALLLVAPVLVIDALRMVRADGARRLGIILLGIYGIAATLLLVVSLTRFETMSNFFGRLSSNDPLTAFGIVLTDRPAYQASPFAPLAVLLPWLFAGAGALVGLRRRSVPALGMTVGLASLILVMVSALIPGPLGPLLTWPWYGDRERLGPVMAIGVIALAGVGLQEIVSLVAHRRQPSPRSGNSRPRAVVVIASVLVLLGASGPLSAGRTALLAEATYQPEHSPYKVYVAESEEDFIERSAHELPDGAVVLGDPRDGTTTYSALGGHEVVFSYLQPPVDVPRKRVARYAYQYQDVPRVCEALESTGATHLYRDTSEDAGPRGASEDDNSEFAGIHALDTSEMELVAQDGPYALYAFDAQC
jgi:hypothetical protein